MLRKTQLMTKVSKKYVETNNLRGAACDTLIYNGFLAHSLPTVSGPIRELASERLYRLAVTNVVCRRRDYEIKLLAPRRTEGKRFTLTTTVRRDGNT